MNMVLTWSDPWEWVFLLIPNDWKWWLMFLFFSIVSVIPYMEFEIKWLYYYLIILGYIFCSEQEIYSILSFQKRLRLRRKALPQNNFISVISVATLLWNWKILPLQILNLFVSLSLSMEWKVLVRVTVTMSKEKKEKERKPCQ